MGANNIYCERGNQIVFCAEKNYLFILNFKYYAYNYSA